jgi:oxygen-independent coproporphyrinogen III oxidase
MCVSISNTDTVQWDKNLIAKYDARGPRYTSYPTAAEFTTAYTEDQYIRALEKVKSDASRPLSLYVHIPFCQDICYYCACNKIVTRDKGAADTYLTHLEKEMALIHSHLGSQRKVAQLHLGGGSPTFLNAGQLTRLIHSISTYFQLTEDPEREYSIEIDPRTVSNDSLALMKGLGFNRISLGVQDFSPAVQKAINRTNSVAMVEDLVIAARDYGFRSINFDLIYGLPEQNLETLKITLEEVIKLNPERIAFYNYAHLPDRFLSQRAIDRQTLPSPEQKLDMLNFISTTLTEAGYIYIGMDHFVKPTDELAIAQKEGHLQRNFQGYSTSHASDLIGLGMSSISSGEHFFSQNQKNLEDYYQAIDSGHLPVEKGLATNADDEKRRAVIMDLIANLDFDIAAWERLYSTCFADYFQPELQKLQVMRNDELINITQDRIIILPKGRAMLRNICMVFDQYYKSESNQYSKII